MEGRGARWASVVESSRGMARADTNIGTLDGKVDVVKASSKFDDSWMGCR